VAIQLDRRSRTWLQFSLVRLIAAVVIAAILLKFNVMVHWDETIHRFERGWPLDVGGDTDGPFQYSLISELINCIVCSAVVFTFSGIADRLYGMVARVVPTVAAQRPDTDSK
jgi:hypothetical protein